MPFFENTRKPVSVEKSRKVNADAVQEGRCPVQPRLHGDGASLCKAGAENHLPVVECSGITFTVMVGAVEHPMVDVHHIQWLYVETEQGGYIRCLHPGEAPKAVFELGEETPVAVYAYCNLHGLWMTKL